MLNFKVKIFVLGYAYIFNHMLQDDKITCTPPGGNPISVYEKTSKLILDDVTI